MRGIDFFNRPGNQADVVVITRGGGSMEDLWGFNSEALARKIAASSVPIVSAIGHEIDFTIADFAASLRAPTPSAAAELIVPDLGNINDTMADYRSRLKRAWDYELLQQQRRLEYIAGSKVFHEPEYLLRGYQQQLDELSGALQRSWSNYEQRFRNHLQLSAAKLAAYDPAGVLKRGYVILLKDDKTPVDSVHKLAPGETLTARFSDGSAELLVK